MTPELFLSLFSSFYGTFFVCGLSDGLTTPITFIGFISSMDSVMNCQIGAPAEALPTGLTRVRLLPRVHSLMGL